MAKRKQTTKAEPEKSKGNQTRVAVVCVIFHAWELADQRGSLQGLQHAP